MAKKQKGNPLESLLRYEIILALFALIGVYYFLTFSPVRMPRQTITCHHRAAGTTSLFPKT